MTATDEGSNSESRLRMLMRHGLREGERNAGASTGGAPGLAVRSTVPMFSQCRGLNQRPARGNFHERPST